jgi:hypothetical protein
MMESDACFTTHLLGHPALSLDLVYFVLPAHDDLLKDLEKQDACPLTSMYLPS